MLNIKKTVTGTEPISLEDAKLWLRVDGDSDDDLITSLITQTRELVEQYLNISIVDTTLEVEASPRIELVLPFGPVQSITSVTDQDSNDVTYTWNGFYISFESPVYSVTGGNTGYVTTVTTYDAGLGTIPAGLNLGLLEMLAWLYENRGDSSGFMMALYQNQNLQPYRSNNVWI